MTHPLGERWEHLDNTAGSTSWLDDVAIETGIGMSNTKQSYRYSVLWWGVFYLSPTRQHLHTAIDVYKHRCTPHTTPLLFTSLTGMSWSCTASVCADYFSSFTSEERIAYRSRMEIRRRERRPCYHWHRSEHFYVLQILNLIWPLILVSLN